MLKKAVQIRNKKTVVLPSETDIVTIIKQNPHDLFWFDYSKITTEEWFALVDSLQLNDLEKLFFIDRKPFPKAEVIQTNGIYLRVPTSNVWEENSHYIHLILLGNILITASRFESKALDKALQQLLTGAIPEGKEGIFMLMYMLESMEENLVNNYLEARNIINEFINNLGTKIIDEHNDKIVENKGKLGLIAGQCEEFLFGCTLLRSILSVPVFPINTKKMLSDIVDTLTHVEHSMRKLDKRLEDQLHRIDSHLRELADKRLRMLTILSSLFLPLTFISSIYGMNFEHMPELAYEYAYPICLLGMVCVGISMLVFFAIKGWFK